MVKLEEVEDEELNQAQPGPIEESDDDYVDTGKGYCSSHFVCRRILTSFPLDSSLSDDEDDDIFPSETISERYFSSCALYYTKLLCIMNIH